MSPEVGGRGLSPRAPARASTRRSRARPSQRPCGGRSTRAGPPPSTAPPMPPRQLVRLRIAEPAPARARAARPNSSTSGRASSAVSPRWVTFSEKAGSSSDTDGGGNAGQKRSGSSRCSSISRRPISLRQVRQGERRQRRPGDRLWPLGCRAAPGPEQAAPLVVEPVDQRRA